MPFSIRPFRRFPVQCSVSYNTGPFQGQGTVWNISLYWVATLRRFGHASGKPFRSPSRCRMSNGSRFLTPRPHGETAEQ